MQTTMPTFPENAVSTQDASPELLKVVHFYETLNPASLGAIDQFYAPQARFIDPFNDVQGLAAITTIFEHMFAAMQAPRFEMVSYFSSSDGREAFLRWNFYFSKAGLGMSKGMCIHGSSFLQLSVDGKITHHQDYWDTGKELFAKLPIFGAVVRWLSRQMTTPQL